MSTKKRAAGLDALKHLSTPPAEPVDETPAQSVAPVETLVSASPSKKSKAVFSLHMPVEAHETLRELSFHERTSITKLIMEGLDLLFEKRGLPSVAELQNWEK